MAVHNGGIKMSLFFDVINHNETQWMVNRHANLSHHDTMAFFCDKVARSMDPDVAQHWKHSWRAQAATTAAEKESLHGMFNACQFMHIPDVLWRVWTWAPNKQ